MSQKRPFHIEKTYFDQKDKNKICFVVWFEHDDDRNCSVDFLLDGEKLAFTSTVKEGLEVERYYDLFCIIAKKLAG